VSQQLMFQRLRWWLLRNSTATILQGSWVRVLSILVCSALVWAGVYVLAAQGFFFIEYYRIALGGLVTGALFDMLFLTLTVGLIFSTSIILYSSLFTSPETRFLLTTPAMADQVFAFKYQGAIAFSSWGFVLLGSPVLVAFGVAFGAPWYYYPMLPLFLVGFVLLPGSIGALICLLIANLLPRKRKQVLIVAILVLLGALALLAYQLRPADWNEGMNRDFVQRLLTQLAAVQGPLAPNHWMTRGLQAAVRGDAGLAGYCLALVWSNGLFLYLVTAWVAARSYRRGYNRVITGGMLRRRYGGAWLDRALTATVGFLDAPTRLLIVKDFRTFRREPSQWAQVLVFMVLVVLYFVNVRGFYEEDIGRPYRSAVSFINLGATALLLCAYTGRFIFPMLSLEGRKFWILGLLPLKREQLLWGKFVFSATWATLAAEFLVIFSDSMLDMPWQIIGVQALAVLVLALGLSGLSVGLGAWIPNFRETDPSKIAVGFGGTLNLVAGLLFILAVLALMVIPWHLQFAVNEEEPLRNTLRWWMTGGVPAGVAVGIAAVLLPLWVGARSLRRMEF
jgi:ABC-2 type transport system permease protein